MKNNFKKYRTSKNLTLTEISITLKIDRTQLSRIDNNTGNISSSIIKKIKEYDPNADIEYILGYRDEPLNIPNRDQDFIEIEDLKKRITELNDHIRILMKTLDHANNKENKE